MTDLADPEKLRAWAGAFSWWPEHTLGQILVAAADRIASQAAEIAELREKLVHLTDDTGETWEDQCIKAREQRNALRVKLAAAEADRDALRARVAEIDRQEQAAKEYHERHSPHCETQWNTAADCDCGADDDLRKREDPTP